MKPEEIVMDLRQALTEVSRQYGPKTAVALGDRRMSYSGLDEASNRVGNALLALGVKKGDRVAMLLSNTPEFAVVFLGIVKVGAVAVPLDTRYKFYELKSLLDSSQARVLVAENPFLEAVVAVLPECKSIRRVIELGRGHAGPFINYQELLAVNSPRAPEVGLEADDAALIFYTSGTTSRPKGAVLSHGSLIAEAEASASGFAVTDKDIVILFALPLYHTFGLEVLLLTSLFKGGTVVIVPGLSIESLMETIERQRATVFMGVPYIYALANNVAEKEGVKSDLSSLRLCVSAAQALPLGVRNRFKHYYGIGITEIYGLSEAVAHVSCQPIDGMGKPCSVGRPLSIWKIKIVDDEAKEVPLNQRGEIIISGPFMQGYYANPEATAEAIKDGWLYTGDIGRIDEDGEIFILGLKKDMILIKGQNIYPVDIEVVLRKHPKVAEAAVVGVPDELKGERIRAVVTLNDGQLATERELQDFCHRYLANYKIPKQIIFVDSLPKTPSGKVCKGELRKL